MKKQQPSISKLSVKKKTLHIINTIKNTCTYKGFLSSYIDGVTKKITYYKVTSDDVADHLSFLLVASKEFNDKKLYTWCMNRFKQQQQVSQLPSGLFIDFDPRKVPLMKHNFHLIQIHFNEDYLVGLSNMYELTKEPIFLQSAQKFVKGLRKYGLSRRNYLYDLVFTPLGLGYPKSYVETTGLYIESLCQLFEITGDMQYVDFAKQIAEPWLNNSFFKQYGYFPEQWNIITNKPSLVKTKVMKSLTNMMFGLMALYLKTNDEQYLKAVTRVLKTLDDHQYVQGVYYQYLTYDKNNGRVCSISNHAMMDVLINYYLITKNSMILKKLESAMNFWYEQQNELGLTPDYPLENNSTCTNDTHGDLAVMFLKYYHLTGKKKYLDYVKRSFHALDYFQNDQISVTSIYPNGTIAGNMNKTKFLGGISKFTLTLYGHLNGKSLIDDRLFGLLMRDR